MIRKAIVLGVGILSLVAPVVAAPQDVPMSLFFLENNSSKSVYCNFKRPGEVWQGWELLEPGDEFTMYADDDGNKGYVVCDETAVYRIWSGKRYSILPWRGDKIQIREIVPSVSDN